MPVVLSNVETKPWFFDIFSFLTTKLTHRYGAPVCRQACRPAEHLSATGQSDQMQRFVSPLIVHNKAAGRYSRKYKPIEINNAMYPIARNFAVNIAILFAPSCVIYNL